MQWELFLEGKTQQAVNICNQLVGAQAGYGAYQPWGDIWFDFTGISTNVSAHERDLDLTTDQLLASYKNGSASEAEKRQLEVMLFQYGRYLTIASSREDSQLPSNLQGVWAEGSVNGLVAHGNFEIAMTWTKGGITSATILSRNGGEAIILADNITLATVTDGKGSAVDFTVTEDDKIVFDTVAGESYTLTIPERPDAPANLAVARDGLEKANLTWNAVEGASYNATVPPAAQLPWSSLPA